MSRPDKLDFANFSNRISQINIKRCNQQFLQIFIVFIKISFMALLYVHFSFLC